MIIDIIILILIYIKLFKKWQKKGKDILLLNTLMYIYISFVLYFTLMPVIKQIPIMISHMPHIKMNMNAFDDLFNHRGDYLRQIILNVIMMIPFGFMYPIQNKSFKKTLLMTFLFSLTIELLQPIINAARSSDITDLITNTVGGIIGYIFYLIFKPLINKILKPLRSNT